MSTTSACRLQCSVNMWTVFRFCVLGAVVMVCTAEGTAVSKKFSNGITSFSLDLFKAVADESKNVVCSPVSLSVLLAMLQQGAEAETLQELTNVIHTNQEDSKQGYSTLTGNLKSSGNVTLENANAAFLNEGFNVKESFKNTIENDFHSTTETIDFSEKAKAAGRINDWVAEHTHDRIKKLVDEDMFSHDTRLVLTNAIYFKGNWTIAFDKRFTVDSDFFVTPDSPKKVPMMYMKQKLKTGELKNLNAKWLELPFKGDRFSLVVILPNEKDGLDSLMSNIKAEDISSVIGNLKDEREIKVELHLPRFKIESTLKLIPALKKLGLKNIFEDDADFKQITEEEKLKVSEVVQKAEIEVNEEGATASAATGILIEADSVEYLPRFEADHPFIALIIDGMNQIPIFLSRIEQP